MNSKLKWLFPIGIIVILAIVIVLWYISAYNGLIKENENVNNKWAAVETQYQRRLDLIPNLVETVKGYKDFEQETLIKIVELRSQWQTSSNINEKVETANEIESILSKLLVITENYPDLKANTNFIALQDELANTENKIAVERQRYNDQVRIYNTKIKVFPNNMIVNKLGYKERAYFQSAKGAENTVDVKFD